MNRPGNAELQIDTVYEPRFVAAAFYDTASLATQRKDVLRMNESIHAMQLNIEAMKLERKPSFRIQYDHMSPLSSMMPKAFSVMGMVSIPIAPWSKKNVSVGNQIHAVQYPGNGTGTCCHAPGDSGHVVRHAGRNSNDAAAHSIHRRKSDTGIAKTFDASFITYQENKLTLTVVLDNWDALNMMRLDVLDEKQKLYQMIVDYEKELFR
ncbi:hypothetical protein LWM68_33975 [Niabella sp. W65]|nr:hypothetical protein [Niabella sp. W65]MCH7367334.1 hypothetical protein [Niabella sp. W65]